MFCLVLGDHIGYLQAAVRKINPTVEFDRDLPQRCITDVTLAVFEFGLSRKTNMLNEKQRRGVLKHLVKFTGKQEFTKKRL